MVRPAPCVITQGENARFCCHVPQTYDFCMGLFAPFAKHRFRHGRACFRPPTSFDVHPKKVVDAGVKPGLPSEATSPSHFACPPFIARQSRSGVAGISMWRTPSGESASTSALATAGSAPTQPASPAPFTPSGLVLVGTGLLLTSTALTSVARGIA